MNTLVPHLNAQAAMYLWSVKNSGVDPFASIIAARRRQERVVEQINLGGFPLFRRESCDSTPGTGIHAALERFTMSAPAGRIHP